MILKALDNVEYSPSYGQKTDDLIKIAILTVFGHNFGEYSKSVKPFNVIL
jgi:hypothetical protein